MCASDWGKKQDVFKEIVKMDELIDKLINVGIPAAMLGFSVVVVFFIVKGLDKLAKYFKQQDIIDEDKKREFLLKRYSQFHTDKKLIIVKPLQNGGKWIIAVMTGKNTYIIMHKVFLNKDDFTKISKEGVFKDSILAILKTYDDGKIVVEKETKDGWTYFTERK